MASNTSRATPPFEIADVRRFSSATVRRLRLGARLASAIVVAVGVVTFLGWILRIDILTVGLPGLPAVKVNTAIGLALLGTATGALTFKGRRIRGLSAALGGLVAIAALATLVEYAFGLDLGIDQALVTDTASLIAPGRPAQATLVALALLGLGCIALAPDRPIARSGDALLLLGGGIGAFACLGYASGATHATSIMGFGSVSLITASALVLLSSAALFARPTVGYAALFATGGAGGTLMRRTLPFALAIPMGTLVLARFGTEVGLYDAGVQPAVASVIGTILLMVFVYAGASSLERSERGRRRAQHVADVDTLTAVHSRGYLLRQVDAMDTTAATYALIAIDADDLKRMNDTLGHGAGDTALVMLAGAIRNSILPTDIVARVGGDEFLVVLRAVSADGIAPVRARIERSIRESQEGQPGLRLDASLGTALRDGGESFAAVWARADSELYEDKVRHRARR